MSSYFHAVVVFELNAVVSLPEGDEWEREQAQYPEVTWGCLKYGLLDNLCELRE